MTLGDVGPKRISSERGVTPANPGSGPVPDYDPGSGAGAGVQAPETKIWIPASAGMTDQVTGLKV